MKYDPNQEEVDQFAYEIIKLRKAAAEDLSLKPELIKKQKLFVDKFTI